MRGPIDYIVVGFEGDKFDGSILRALSEVIDSGIINLLVLTVFRKDKEGNIMVVDIADMGDSYTVDFVEKYASELGQAEPDDIDEVSDLLQNDTAAGLLIIEHLWARPLKQAIMDANGVLVAEGRIHPEAAVELSK